MILGLEWCIVYKYLVEVCTNMYNRNRFFVLLIKQADLFPCQSKRELTLQQREFPKTEVLPHIVTLRW